METDEALDLLVEIDLVKFDLNEEILKDLENNFPEVVSFIREYYFEILEH